MSDDVASFLVGVSLGFIAMGALMLAWGLFRTAFGLFIIAWICATLAGLLG